MKQEDNNSSEVKVRVAAREREFGVAPSKVAVHKSPSTNIKNAKNLESYSAKLLTEC